MQIDLKQHLGYCLEEHILEKTMNISLKNKVKYWFWFLRLAHESNDPRVAATLKSSKSFYEPWDDYLHGSFDSWWKGHSSLFKESESLTKMSVGDVVEGTDALYLRIPFIYAPTTVSRIVERMYREEYERRAISTSKVKKVYGGRYQLSAEDFQVTQFDYYLRFTRDVFLPLTNQTNKAKVREFMELALETFSKQKLKRTLKDGKRAVPFNNQDADPENLKRQVRRYRTISENLLLNVAQGKFPGNYTP